MSDQNLKKDENWVARAEVRLQRSEGVLEDRVCYVSKAKSMEKVNEILTRLRRDSMSGVAAESSVWITGKQGTGKEGIARMIHAGSRRGRNAWISVNCAQFLGQSLEAELFGYEPGAISGTTTQKKGAIELAHGGTLYLEGVDLMSESIQAKLLKALNEKKFQRMGGAENLEFNVRLIVSTEESLLAKSRNGQFLGALYDLLNQTSVSIPSLKDRTEDILPMAIQFAERSCHALGKTFKGFTPELQSELKEYSWPGNVRELYNLVEISAIRWEGKGYITDQEFSIPGRTSAKAISYSESSLGVVHKLQLVNSNSQPSAPSQEQTSYTEMKKHWCDSFEKDYLIQALRKNKGNVSVAAREAKLDRSNFLRLLRRHGLKAQDYREVSEMIKAA